MTLANVVLEGPSAKFEVNPALQNTLEYFSFYNKSDIEANKRMRINLKSSKESFEEHKKEIENKYKKGINSDISDLSLGQILEKSDRFANANYKLLMSGLRGFFKSLDVSKIDYNETLAYDLVMLNHSLNMITLLKLSECGNSLDKEEMIKDDMYYFKKRFRNVGIMMQDIMMGYMMDCKSRIKYSMHKEGYINLCNLVSNVEGEEFEKEAFSILEHFSLNYSDRRMDDYKYCHEGKIPRWPFKIKKGLSTYDSLKRKFSDKVINERLNKILKSDKNHLELVNHIEKLSHSIDDYNNRLSENILNVVDNKYKVFGYNLEFGLQRVTSLEEGTVSYKGKIKIEGEPKSMNVMEKRFYKHMDNSKRELLERLKSEKIGQVEDCGKINVRIDTPHHGIVLDYKIEIPNIPTQEETFKVISNAKDFFERGTEKLINLSRTF